MVVGGLLEGELIIRLRDIGCLKTPKLDVGADVKLEAKIGRFGISFQKDIMPINGKPVGSQWIC